jgi:hypothetical protein
MITGSFIRAIEALSYANSSWQIVGTSYQVEFDQKRFNKIFSGIREAPQFQSYREFFEVNGVDPVYRELFEERRLNPVDLSQYFRSAHVATGLFSNKRTEICQIMGLLTIENPEGGETLIIDRTSDFASYAELGYPLRFDHLGGSAVTKKKFFISWQKKPRELIPEMLNMRKAPSGSISGVPDLSCCEVMAHASYEPVWDVLEPLFVLQGTSREAYEDKLR